MPVNRPHTGHHLSRSPDPPAPDLRSLVPGFRFPTPDPRSLVPGSRFPIPGPCTGASLAALAIDKVSPNFAREYAKLPDYALKRIGEIDHSLANEVIVGKPERK